MQLHEQWHARAQEDLSFAQIGFREKYFAQACFLSHQAVEKALKGLDLEVNRTDKNSKEMAE